MANKQVRLTPAETKLIEVIRTFELDPIEIRNQIIKVNYLLEKAVEITTENLEENFRSLQGR